MAMEGALKYALNSREIKKFLLEWGATLVGFGDVSRGLAGELRHLPVAISLAIRHPSPGRNLIHTTRGPIYSNRYQQVDLKLEQLQKRLVSLLKSHGFKCLAIPPDSHRHDTRFVARLYPLFPHKTAATCAGLGWIGKNGLLVNETYGPRLSWATVLTNAPLEVCTTPYVSGRCGKCRRCVEACPAGAIADREWVRDEGLVPHIDVEACRRQLERNRLLVGEDICGLCILACPRGMYDQAGTIKRKGDVRWPG
ncbi:4Fe-4S double cluster binding domain-containing protein [Desulfofundulus thermocisternus]|uniref:4Fe-4S double cluster binding domain-containing protein n=1 Tax=Desulfofundulus thermocisternus TaxID=42471 RepID=UPI00217E8395|nr:4Fe-4S dicluster domain-containing protein [Desulfofundulus thermocisternus]MCS5696843.1 4Fe-4S dicluster domain-containing protein [Desulfofundulus thermocisternus]